MYNDTKLEAEIAAIDLMGPEPSDEHSRELYYIGRLRTLIADRSAEAGRKLTACTVTFGCQMNARDSEKLIGILSSLTPVRSGTTRTSAPSGAWAGSAISKRKIPI